MLAHDLNLLDLSTPLGHYDRLHRTPHGTVVAWERPAPGKRWAKIEPHHPVAALLGPYQGRHDVFITVNEFRHWRLIRNLKSLRACYIDIDGCTDWEAALDALLEAKQPQPSFMVLSGRGIHFYWILEPLPARALPVWQRVQDTLVNALAPLGADYRAKDCTRLLRLAGTINSRNGEEVVGRNLTGEVWTLHELADEVLGPRVQPATVFDFKAQASRRRRKIQTPGKGSIYAWWHLVHTDLVTVANHHWLGGVPEGKRDTFLFLMANALSWFACPQTLETEIIQTAKTFTPGLTQREIQTYTKPILKRAQAATEGKKYHWEGKEVDPRYAFRAETLRQWLGEETIPPELWPDLRALAPKEVIRERKREREKTRDRVAEGRYQRKQEDFLREQTQQRIETANDRRSEALKLREEGLNWKEVAEQMGISTNAAKLLGSRAKKEQPTS